MILVIGHKKKVNHKPKKRKRVEEKPAVDEVIVEEDIDLEALEAIQDFKEPEQKEQKPKNKRNKKRKVKRTSIKTNKNADEVNKTRVKTSVMGTAIIIRIANVHRHNNRNDGNANAPKTNGNENA